MYKYDITGQRFGTLTVIKRCDPSPGERNSKWLCKCDCGNEITALRCSLVSGHTKSCGANLHRKGVNSTHGMTGTRLFHEWLSMRRRCKPNSSDSKTYYDRGIFVCEEWEQNFDPFYNWAIASGYADNLSIDRINNDDGYHPGNCRWIPIEEQQSNKSNTVRINIDGKERCLRTYCNQIGFPYKTAHLRYRRMKQKGIPIDIEKLFLPVDKNKMALRYRNAQ